MKNILIAICLSFLLLIISLSLAFAEEITLSTYYPAPHGVYKNFITTEDTYLATAGGNVGIGTTSPSEKLQVNGKLRVDNTQIWDNEFNRYNNDNLYIGYRNTANTILQANSGNVGIGTASPGTKLDVSGSAYVSSNITAGGTITANSFVYSSSDVSLKKNLQGIPEALEKIQRLNPVTFTWKKDGQQGLGLLAQDVEAVFPELVATDMQTGLKSLAYGNLIAPLIEAVKEQQGQINQQRMQIRKLNQEIQQLKLATN